jgi:O-antigen/teichoic acid export membrane protein
MIHMRIDQILVGYMFGSYEVGIYAASIRISEISYSILALIIASLFPAILNAKNKDEEMYRERLKKMYSFIIYISIITAIPVVIFSKEFVLFLYGNSYSTSSELLNIHIWTGTFIALGIASRQWYITENLAELELIRTISGLIINIILCLALAPKFGLFGIAYSTLISHVVSGLIFDFANKKTINMAKIKIKALYPTAN